MPATLPMLRFIGAAFAFGLVLLAGCFVPGDAPAPPTSDGPPTPPPPYSTFACGEGRNTPAASAGLGNGSRCNVRITGNLPGMNGPANELTIAVDPSNPLRLIAGAKDYTLGPDANCGANRVWAGYYWSDDGGLTWGNDLMPGHDLGPQQQSTNPLAGYHCTTDPVAYWDFDGNAYYSGLSYSQQTTDLGDVGSNMWLAKSTDGGRTYPTINLVAQGDGVTVFHDKQWFTIDEVTGNIYFTWSAFVFVPPLPGNPNLPASGTDQIVFSRSEDGGETWTPPRVLYETEAAGPVTRPSPELEKQFSAPQVDATGAIHVIWMSEPKGEIWYTRSTDQGVTWTDPRVVVSGIDPLPSPLPPTDFRSASYPVMAIDRSDNPTTRGNLYVVYPTMNGERHADVFLVRSMDAGATWSNPAMVNDDNTTTDQWMPWMDVGPAGDVHVVYYDRRFDSANRLLDVSYAHSRDGITFDSSVRLTEVSSDSSVSYHQSGATFIGDYIGIVEGANGWVHPIWVDTRDGAVAHAYTTAIRR